MVDVDSSLFIVAMRYTITLDIVNGTLVHRRYLVNIFVTLLTVMILERRS